MSVPRICSNLRARTRGSAPSTANGFSEEGLLRQHEFLSGDFHDVVLLGLTAPEHWATHPRPSLR